MDDRMALVRSGRSIKKDRDLGSEFDKFDDVRVGRIVAPVGYYDTRPDGLFCKIFVWFQEERLARGAHFKGYVQAVDPLHSYSLLCKKAIGEKKVHTMTKMVSATRLPLDMGKLRSLAVKFGNTTESDAEKDTKSMSQDARRGVCGSVLREVGDFAWYKALEHKFPNYFSLWYVDELCKVYKRASIRSLSIDDVFALARFAAKEPWKLCFWWRHELSIVEELSAEEASKIAGAFGSSLDRSMQIAAQAYSGKPFGDARDRGDSYVSLEEFKRCVADCSVRKTLYDSNVVVVVQSREGTDTSVPPEFQVYSVGDRECETEIARVFHEATSVGTDDVSVYPESCRWPWSDPDANPLTDEQAAAVRRALKTRLFVCDGKPGTGKTSYVIKSIVSAFPRGTAIGVAFTGMAAKKLKDTVGTGVTAHKIIDSWRRDGAEHRYYGHKVLILEEASTMSIRLLRVLMTALGGTIRRIYAFGDHRQMAPPGGGSSVLRAMLDRYRGTPMAAELTVSMRIVDDDTGAFVRNLDRICDHNGGKRVSEGDPRPTLALEWSSSPASRCPFVFLRRGSTDSETVAIIRDALTRSGADPDSSTGYQIVVHTNDLRRSLGKAWYVAGSFAKEVSEFREHSFRIGERVMFLENNYGFAPRGSEFQSDEIMNGTVGVISEAFDEDLLSDDRTVIPIFDTGVEKSTPSSIRWIRIAHPIDALVSLDTYHPENIVRSQPATVAKMQGQETDVVVVYLDEVRVNTTYSRRELYTACSRGRRRCIVIGGTGRDAMGDGSLAPCPDPDLVRIIEGTSKLAERTAFWKSFKSYEEIGEATLARSCGGPPPEKRSKMDD